MKTSSAHACIVPCRQLDASLSLQEPLTATGLITSGYDRSPLVLRIIAALVLMGVPLLPCPMAVAGGAVEERDDTARVLRGIAVDYCVAVGLMDRRRCELSCPRRWPDRIPSC